MIDKVIIKANDETKIHIDGVTYDLDNVIAAVEKQIPKNPKCQGSDEQDVCFCPICDNPICTIEEVILWDMKQKYCDRCGQRLDWGVENENDNKRKT